MGARFSSPLGSGHDYMGIAAPAMGAEQPLATVGNRSLGPYRRAISAGSGST
jgi:hypothetical protein